MTRRQTFKLATPKRLVVAMEQVGRRVTHVEVDAAGKVTMYLADGQSPVAEQTTTDSEWQL
jgi:uncharacterized protein YgfB (UPF0149 family)